MSNKKSRLARLGSAAALTLSATFCITAASAAQAAEKFTAWGWPQPYEQISQKSIDWLKDKGWWPLKIAYQAPWSGQNTVNIVMDKKGLLKARGLQSELSTFASGPAINEVLVSGRYQVGNGGNFPFTSLIDKKMPVKAIGILSPNLAHALLVPIDSPAKSLKDFKGSNPPASIGLVTGSSAEFYIQMAAKVNGIEIGKDIILKNMPPGDQMAMPKGLSGVVSWDPTVSMIRDERKNGRVIDSIYPYNMYEGQYYVRQELIDNVPDVVQALSDAFVEAVLWQRLHPKEAVKLMKEDPNLKNYSDDLLLKQVELYSNYYKPTYVYPHAEFWGKVNHHIFAWLHENGRIRNALTADDFVKAVDANFMNATFKKLGWAIPKQPPFLPANWSGSPEKIPYPDYMHAYNMDGPQAFPEKGDLVSEWTFNGKTHTP